ncbi:Cilia- and flagella-associated protein 36 [Anabarilius grahami]|uniref:Cilia- and flagella-associated protein 36 n=1 Tax=Anabarilius grahami TaxID=495550 RepID=A0A3N0XV30_ANAGA|nr:Cilia- and flagella-associated protein 36 [Anabarilius grahami]
MADDSEWVLESIAGYLSSPDWLIPLAEFMENKCSVFDDEDENKLSYTEIHQQYKQLVERLLENHMQEVGISEQQFLHACSSFTSSRTLQHSEVSPSFTCMWISVLFGSCDVNDMMANCVFFFKQAVFQPVLATDDFQMFRSLMVQKNMELQLQALHVIKERNGGLPECLTNGVDVMNELEQQEMKILQEVLRRSKEEYDLEMIAHRTQEKEEPASTSSSLSDTPPGNTCEPQTACDSGTRKTNATNGVTEATELKLKQSESAAVKSSATASRKGKALPAVRAPVKGSASANHTSPERTRDDDTQRDSKPLADEVALQQRSEYLKQQRDKLQALKRDQTLKSPADAPPAAPEPRASSQEISVEEKKKLQKRKHLAEKLKEEVIKK